MQASQVALVVKISPVNAGGVRDVGLIPGWERSPGGGCGKWLHYSCLENPMDRGAWRAIVHEVSRCWTWLKWLSMQACTGTRTCRSLRLLFRNSIGNGSLLVSPSNSFHFGVGFYFAFINCHAWEWALVSQSGLTLHDSTHCSLPGSSVRRISYARILEWAVITSSRGSSWPGDRTRVSTIGCRSITISEPPGYICCFKDNYQTKWLCVYNSD